MSTHGAMERDYYQVLGIARTADRAEIRAAYIRLVRHHHPDTVGHLPSRLRDVQRAYRCLSDDGARAAHDRAIFDGERAHQARQHRIQRRLDRFDRSRSRKPAGLGSTRRTLPHRLFLLRLHPLVVVAVALFLLLRLALG